VYDQKIGRHPLFQSHLPHFRPARLIQPFLRLCGLLRRLLQVGLRDRERERAREREGGRGGEKDEVSQKVRE